MPTANIQRRRVALVVLDGWGYRKDRDANAIALARTPTWDKIWSTPTKTLLEASGLRVGLPRGQMGNSEVGHLNLGAGRVVIQDLVRINTAIEDGSFFRNPALLAACAAAKKPGATLHLIGLVGAGGVHAIDTHLLAAIGLARQENVERVAIHAFLDGRDTLPKSALGYLRQLGEEIAKLAGGKTSVKIASVSGRYFAMDRDRRWDRTELAYRAIVRGEGPRAPDALTAIQKAYDEGATDEFVKPVVIESNGAPVAPLRDGDAVICFNYRSDRMRQIVSALITPDFSGFDVSDRPRLTLVTLTSYDRTFPVPVAFAPTSMERILAQVLSETGLTMLKTAETEKYPHVTYFFNGGVEKPYKGEERVLVPSPKVATYDLKPEMSAAGVTDELVKGISSLDHNFILCNYANADMVGHSGSIPATIKAVETVDECLARVLPAAEKAGFTLIVTADHGNAEQMIDPETGGPHTAHTTNPVPFVVLGGKSAMSLRGGGALCDVAPTILSMLGIEQPREMSGVNLGDNS
jgi:2,3-bisphosphoglycerate-independent phosphoglycerate mutase